MPRRSNDVLSVEQTATIVGVGRQSAYAQCRRWLATDGAEGIPCRRVGRLILVYRHELERWLGFRIVLPQSSDAPRVTSASAPQCPAPRRSRSTSRSRSDIAEQTTLPF
jgi:hypothetical protein